MFDFIKKLAYIFRKQSIFAFDMSKKFGLHLNRLPIFSESLNSVVPNRWVAKSSLNSLLKFQNFVTAHIDIVYYISKTEMRSDLCEVHMIYIIIPIWFLLYSFNRPDCRIDSCAGRVNPRGLRKPAFAGRARDEKFFVLVTECWAKAH